MQQMMYEVVIKFEATRVLRVFADSAAIACQQAQLAVDKKVDELGKPWTKEFPPTHLFNGKPATPYQWCAEVPVILDQSVFLGWTERTEGSQVVT